jgi:NIMA (never in mitosis gene a)-related kinase 2
VMEFCEGGDLSDYIRRHKRDRAWVKEEVVKNVLVQVLMALHDCHRHRPNKVLHRDLKPGNIFLDSKQRIKLGDFGLARTLNPGSMARTNVGTPLYMSPEQIRHQRYDQYSDIWSLGCVLYELMALSPPFEAATQESLAIKIKAGHYRPLPAHFSRELRDIVTRMLQLDPKRRPSTDKLIATPPISQCYHEVKLQAQFAQVKREKEELARTEAELAKREAAVKERERLVEAAEKAAAKAPSRVSAPPPPPQGKAHALPTQHARLGYGGAYRPTDRARLHENRPNL